MAPETVGHQRPSAPSALEGLGLRELDDQPGLFAQLRRGEGRLGLGARVLSASLSGAPFGRKARAASEERGLCTGALPALLTGRLTVAYTGFVKT